MALYVDANYYINQYHGTVLTGNDIEKYLKLAQEKIDEITFDRIIGIGFDNLTTFQKEKVGDAICSQAEYISENGYDNEGDVSSYSVLDITVNEKDSNSESEKLGMSSYAYSQIKKTGLTCRSFRW